MASKGEGEDGFGTFGPCTMNECEGGLRLACVGVEALSVVLRKLVCVSVEWARRKSKVAHAGADNPVGVG